MDKRFRVLYGENQWGDPPTWSRPMSRADAVVYMAIFKEAIEVVEIRATKAERREKQARKGRMHRVHNSFRRVLRALIDKRKR